jgi:hypothetical protein
MERSMSRGLTALARWPLGVGLTSWRYLWRTTPLHRSEIAGVLPDDAPPELPAEVDSTGLQHPEQGAGPLFHRIYRARIRDCEEEPEQLMARFSRDPDEQSPSEFASFAKRSGPEGEMRVGDDYVVHMAGPWDGPVRVIRHDPCSFRLATLEGHLESGQIEFRARREDDDLIFEIESWARSSDRLTDVLYDHLRMSKEVQLHMWVSVLERVARSTGGSLRDGIEVRTKRVPEESLDD